MKQIEQQNRDAAKSTLTEVDLRIIQQMIDKAFHKKLKYEDA